jgi:hypothetical protein
MGAELAEFAGFDTPIGERARLFPYSAEHF